MSHVDTAAFPPVELEGGSVEQAVHAMIERAAEWKASDLFFATNEASVVVSVRHLGIVRPLNTFPLDHGRHMINYLKAVSGLDISDHRQPVDGRWLYEFDSGAKLDLRISVIPTLFGEDVAMRLLDRETSLRSIHELGMSSTEYNQMIAMLNNPSGLILVTGPTGSGKTTTLYACLNYLCNGKRKINTLEDPIEYSIPGVRQSQMNERIGVDFPRLLPHILRQSPDVIMIGEIRDPVTAQTAVRAAGSGHLVLATLHAPAAASAVDSMRALGVHPHFLATSLLGVVSQRLVRVLCDQCKIPIDMSAAPDSFEELAPWLTEDEGKTMYSPGHCDACYHTGYAQRSGVFEILGVSKTIRRMITNLSPAREIEQQAIEEGMLELRRSSLLKVAQGATSTEELFRVIPSELLDQEYE